jgi:hypothetical protein
MQAYKVTARRDVPAQLVSTGMITGKQTIEQYTHANSKAVMVKLDNQNTAWGFGFTWEIAEARAVKSAMAI